MTIWYIVPATYMRYRLQNRVYHTLTKSNVREERRKGVKSMKILRKPVIIQTPKPETKKQERKSHKNELPPDTFPDLIPEKRINVDEGNDLVISVKRGGEFGLPRVDIRHYVKTEHFEGFTKKGINFNLEFLYDLIGLLNDVDDECTEKGLDKEFDV